MWSTSNNVVRGKLPVRPVDLKRCKRLTFMTAADITVYVPAHLGPPEPVRHELPCWIEIPMPNVVMK